jgi:hypothetical protein
MYLGYVSTVSGETFAIWVIYPKGRAKNIKYLFLEVYISLLNFMEFLL